MERPSDVTDEDLARWEESFKEQSTDTKYFPQDILRDLWYASNWLQEKLIAGGFTETEARHATFAHGQRVAALGDPWGQATNMLARALQGDLDKPGRELGSKLLKESIEKRGFVEVMTESLSALPDDIVALLKEKRLDEALEKMKKLEAELEASLEE